MTRAVGARREEERPSDRAVSMMTGNPPFTPSIQYFYSFLIRLSLSVFASCLPIIQLWSSVDGIVRVTFLATALISFSSFLFFSLNIHRSTKITKIKTLTKINHQPVTNITRRHKCQTVRYIMGVICIILNLM